MASAHGAALSRRRRRHGRRNGKSMKNPDVEHGGQNNNGARRSAAAAFEISALIARVRRSQTCKDRARANGRANGHSDADSLNGAMRRRFGFLVCCIVTTVGDVFSLSSLLFCSRRWLRFAHPTPPRHPTLLPPYSPAPHFWTACCVDIRWAGVVQGCVSVPSF